MRKKTERKATLRERKKKEKEKEILLTPLLSSFSEKEKKKKKNEKIKNKLISLLYSTPTLSFHGEGKERKNYSYSTPFSPREGGEKGRNIATCKIIF